MNERHLRRLRDRASESLTLINEGCKISGLITGSGDLMVNGEVDGDCDLGGTLTLTEAGLWKGTIKAGNVIISGRVDGDIVAAGRVEITGSAEIAGTVSGAAIAVAEGAIVEGVMQTSAQEAPVEFVEKRGPGA